MYSLQNLLRPTAVAIDENISSFVVAGNGYCVFVSMVRFAFFCVLLSASVFVLFCFVILLFIFFFRFLSPINSLLFA